MTDWVKSYISFSIRWHYISRERSQRFKQHKILNEKQEYDTHVHICLHMFCSSFNKILQCTIFFLIIPFHKFLTPTFIFRVQFWGCRPQKCIFFYQLHAMSSMQQPLYQFPCNQAHLSGKYGNSQFFICTRMDLMKIPCCCLTHLLCTISLTTIKYLDMDRSTQSCYSDVIFILCHAKLVSTFILSHLPIDHAKQKHRGEFYIFISGCALCQWCEI